MAAIKAAFLQNTVVATFSKDTHLDSLRVDATTGTGTRDIIDLALRTLHLTPFSAILLVCLVVGSVSSCVMCAVKVASQSRTQVGKICSLAVSQSQLLVPGTFLLFFNSGLLLLLPVFGGQFIQIVNNGGGTADDVTRLFWELLTVVVVSSFVQMFRGGLFVLAGERIVRELRKEAFMAIMHQDVAYVDEQSSGILVGKLMADSHYVQEAATGALSQLVRTSINVVMCFVIMLLLSWKLTITMLLTVPAMTMLAWFVGRANDKAGEAYSKSIGDACEVASESFSNHRTVRAFQYGQKWMQRRWRSKSEVVYRKGLWKAMLAAFNGAASFTFFWLGFAVVLRSGAIKVLEGELSSGALLAFVLYTMNMSASVLGLSNMVPQYMNVKGSTRKLFQILHREPAIVDGALEPLTCQGRVDFCSVHFAYPARKDVT
eukprot:3828199-Amphidinium_carterae.1